MTLGYLHRNSTTTTNNGFPRYRDTTGIDIKTKYALHELIWELAAQGRAILLISSEMPEMIRLADRILVMKDHRIVTEINNTHQYGKISSIIIKHLT